MRRPPPRRALCAAALGLLAAPLRAQDPATRSLAQPPERRHTQAGTGTTGTPEAAAAAPAGHRPLVFPADHGAHLATRLEWWYTTGWLVPAQAPPGSPPAWGFQLTFFRTRTGVPDDHPSAFAARQVLVAHAALTQLPAGGAPGRYLVDQRIARAGFQVAGAASDDTHVHLRDWQLRRQPQGGPGGTYHAQARSNTFVLDLQLVTSQPVLAHGDAGWMRKGPQPDHVNAYYTHPQLDVRGSLAVAGAPVQAVRGKAWFDHEWDNRLPPGAVGWDWLGMNLDDGAALMVMRLRRADGSTLWAGGTWRAGSTAPARRFAPGDLQFSALRHWTSPATGTRYPVQWALHTPVGRFTVTALRDEQELDSRASTGNVYWEGLSALEDDAGQRVGLGYLEMTGYQRPLRLGL